MRRSSSICPSSLLITVLCSSLVAASGCGSGTKNAPAATGGDATAGSNGSTAGTTSGGTSSAGTAGSSAGGSATSGASGGATGPQVPAEDSVPLPSEPLSAFIVVDQFGYLPDSEKLAVLRQPLTGADAPQEYTAGSKYQLIDAQTKAVVAEPTAMPWNGGSADPQSGDRVWRVDFSSVKTPGVYYLLDVDKAARSDVFRIADDVYRKVLYHAFRTFYYQRAGFAKTEEFAGKGYADGASHVGAGQDKNARLYGKTDDASTERDLSGGWYDAGDYNRYTPWTADYITVLLRMYEETPEVFGDDFDLPDSGNGTSDLLDEVRFGLPHLVRTQSESGGCISVLGVGSGSPPSAATAPSTYGPETTNATIRAGIAFAWAARVFRDTDAALSADLLSRAKKAWDWAEANPAVEFSNSGKVAAGDQQASAKEVALYKLALALALYRADKDGGLAYKTFFEAGYEGAALGFLNNYNAAWDVQFTEFYLDYTTLPDADPAIKKKILDAFNGTITSDDNLGALTKDSDSYLAYVKDYTWGSNAHKSRTGCLQYDVISFGTDATKNADARRAAERYVHYLHGVNPLQLVYLSNMKASGAGKSVTTFFHSWFVDKSPIWDEVGVSTFGPAPGFLVGGPNPSYSLDAVCPGNAMCPATPPSPPSGQPPQKAYASFNDSWPVNSWAVTENSNGYQVYYLRLLAKFVR